MKTNKINLLKFWIIILSSVISGVVIFSVLSLAKEGLLSSMENIKSIIGVLSGYAIITISIVGSISCLWSFCRLQMKHHESTKSGSENDLKQLQYKFTSLMSLIEIVMISSFMLYGIFLTDYTSGRNKAGTLFLLCTIIFIFMVFLLFFVQRRVALLLQKGDTINLRFNKELIRRHDKSEQNHIYQSAYKAYAITQNIYPFLWVATIMMDILFDTGAIPTIMICIPWLIPKILYYTESFKLLQSGELKV